MSGPYDAAEVWALNLYQLIGPARWMVAYQGLWLIRWHIIYGMFKSIDQLLNNQSIESIDGKVTYAMIDQEP